MADRMCGGSTRKLIAGWWYSILAVTFLLTMLSFWIVSTRQPAEAFASVWSTIILILLSVGGTMVMRKFHNSFFTGLFIGGIVATAQYFFLLSMIFGGYAVDRQYLGYSGAGDYFQAAVAFIQAILLGSFAMLLTAHRSEIMDRSSNLHKSGGGSGGASGRKAEDSFREVDDGGDIDGYNPPAMG